MIWDQGGRGGSNAIVIDSDIFKSEDGIFMNLHQLI